MVATSGLLLPSQITPCEAFSNCPASSSAFPISYLFCSCLSHCHGCLIIQALCHKAAENPISHLLMVSVFSLSYSTIMYQAQWAPTASLWMCSGWKMSLCPQHTDFSQGKNITPLWRGRTWFQILTMMPHFFTSQSLHLLFFLVPTVSFFLLTTHNLPPLLGIYLNTKHSSC